MRVLLFILAWTALSLPVGILVGKIIAGAEAGEAILRHRIALYRGYLSEGVAAPLAVEYLRQIAEDEAELAAIEGGDRRQPGSTRQASMRTSDLTQ
jgi:hypothetical protein